MKIALAFVAAVLFSNVTLAQGKIAVLDLQRAILSTEAAKKELKALNAAPEYSKLTAQAESLNAEMKALAEDLQTKGLTWSNERQAKQRKDIEYKRADMQLVAQKLKQEQNEIVQKLINQYIEKARAVTNDIIKSGGYGLVLQPQAVIHADTGYDITAQITDRLNKAK
ncbi:OmpH family outer membrane protein [Pseudoteredinibacter isoporae]|nr:OmpH family outer membrane protein [Pseudoteredinibacter isoporae]